jgi:hypothetical protein
MFLIHELVFEVRKELFPKLLNEVLQQFAGKLKEIAKRFSYACN